jgi:hypothetical protein
LNSNETYLERIERLINFEGWPEDIAELHVHDLAIKNRQDLWETIRQAHFDSTED